MIYRSVTLSILNIYILEFIYLQDIFFQEIKLELSDSHPPGVNMGVVGEASEDG